MQVERAFENLRDSLSYGCVPVFSGLESLGVRVLFQSEEPEGGVVKSGRKSIGDPLGRSELFRSIVSMWGDDPDQRCFAVGIIAGAFIFFVSDSAGGIASVASREPYWSAHNAGKQYRQLDCAWSATGEMSLWLDGIRVAKVTDQTGVPKTGLATSDLCLGAQPAGNLCAPPGLRLYSVTFWPELVSTGRLDSSMNGGMRVESRGPLIGSMGFTGDASSREEFRGPHGVISLGEANFAAKYSPPILVPDYDKYLSPRA